MFKKNVGVKEVGLPTFFLVEFNYGKAKNKGNKRRNVASGQQCCPRKKY